jgi:hypothetical protein
MDNPEQMATLGKQDTGRRQTKLRDNEVTTFGTQDGGRRQTQLRGNEDWTIQRNWQHLVHKTEDEDKQH